MWRDAAGHLVALLRQTAPPDGDAITLAQGSTMLSQGPTGSAPGTASVYKMRLRADPHRSQITDHNNDLDKEGLREGVEDVECRAL